MSLATCGHARCAVHQLHFRVAGARRRLPGPGLLRPSFAPCFITNDKMEQMRPLALFSLLLIALCSIDAMFSNTISGSEQLEAYTTFACDRDAAVPCLHRADVRKIYAQTTPGNPDHRLELGPHPYVSVQIRSEKDLRLILLHNAWRSFSICIQNHFCHPFQHFPPSGHLVGFSQWSSCLCSECHKLGEHQHICLHNRPDPRPDPAYQHLR